MAYNSMDMLLYPARFDVAEYALSPYCEKIEEILLNTYSSNRMLQDEWIDYPNKQGAVMLGIKYKFLIPLLFLTCTLTAKSEDSKFSPFAFLPLYIQNYSEVIYGNVKPNLLFYVDDSGSMAWDHPSRISVVKASIKNIINNSDYTDEFHWSIRGLNRYDELMDDYGTASDVTKALSKYYPLGGTRSTWHYYHAASFALSHFDYICQTSHIIMLSDGAVNEEDIKYYYNWYNNSALAAIAGQITKSENYDPEGSGSGDGISRFSHPLVLKDVKTGAGTDVEGRGWDDGITYTDSKGDLQTLYKDQHIQTFTIGFGDDIKDDDDAIAYLTNAGATIDSTETSYYYAANDETTLTNVFSKIVDSIAFMNENSAVEQKVSSSSPGMVASNDTKYPALSSYFTLDTDNWSSALKFASIDSTTGVLTSTITTPTYKNRKILVSDADGNVRDLDNMSSEYNNIFGFQLEDEFNYGLVPWLYRTSTDALIEKNVAKKVSANSGKRVVSEFRNRQSDGARMMSDIINSPLLAMGVNASTNRNEYLVTAANDGMVYIFKALDNQNTPYELALNYLPAAMQRESSDDSDTVGKNLKALATENYGTTFLDQSEDAQPHLYLNDGGMQYRISSSKTGKGQTVFVVGAMGRGGRGAYMLNIGGKDRVSGTDIGLDATESLWGQSVPIAETSKGESNDLGYTLSTPQLGLVATKWNQGAPNYQEGVRQYMFLANGYAPNKGSTAYDKYDEQAALYVYEVLGQEMGLSAAVINGDAPGTLVKKISVTGGESANGLSTPVIIDSDGDGVIDHAYAGDYAGNLYRFDLTGTKDGWNAVKIYQGKTTQPITIQPKAYKVDDSQYIVVFGTGTDIYQDDLKNNNQQVIVGIYDDLTDKSPSAIDLSQLTAQSISVKNSKRYLSNNSLRNNLGWYVELLDGERVVTDTSLLASTIFVTTKNYNYQTTADINNIESCRIETATVSEAGSWLMSINIKTGSNPSSKSAYINSLEDNGDMASGFSLEGNGSQIIIASLTENSPSALDANGMAQSGEDDVVLGETSSKSNECMDSDDWSAYVTQQSAEGLAQHELTVPLCATSKGFYRTGFFRIL